MDGEKVLRLIRQLSPTKKVNKTEWRWLSEEYDLARPTRCSACGHAISNVVRIAAKFDLKRQIHLGTDCYALLESEWGGEPLARSARATAVLRARYKSRIKEIYGSHPFVHDRRGDGSWSHWLLVQSGLPSRKLPDDVKAGVSQLKQHKFILDERLLQACVAFHNAHRTFDARVVLGGDFAWFVSSSITQLTIDQALELRAKGPNLVSSPTPLAPPGPRRIVVTPIVGPAPPRRAVCPLCLASVGAKRLLSHQQRRCPKRARVAPSQSISNAPTKLASTTVTSDPSLPPAPPRQLSRRRVNCPWCLAEMSEMDLDSHQLRRCPQREAWSRG